MQCAYTFNNITVKNQFGQELVTFHILHTEQIFQIQFMHLKVQLRNELLAFEIRINIVTMGFDLIAFIARIYGMNLTNGFEQNPYAFYAVAGTTLCFIGGAIAIAFVRLLRYRKVRLHRSNKIDIF